MRKLWAVVPAGVLGLLGLFAWMLLRNDGTAPIASRAPMADRVESTPPPLPAIEPMREPVTIEKEETDYDSNAVIFNGVGALPSRRTAFDLGSMEFTERIEVDVDVIVTDESGVEHTHESGELLPGQSRRSIAADGSAVVRGGRFYWSAVAIQDGTCRVLVEEGSKLVVRGLVLGGRPAVCDFAPIEVEAGKRVTVRARWIESVPLRVFDAATGAELRSFTLQTRSPFLTDRAADPDVIPWSGDVEFAVRAESPFRIPPPSVDSFFDFFQSYWVGAPGRAWKRIDVDFADSAEKRVALAAAASMIVELEGELPTWTPNFAGAPHERYVRHAESPELRLRDRVADELAEDLFFTSMPAVLGPTRIDGLPPGELLVSVVIDHFGEHVLREVATTLVAGKTTKVSLRVSSDASLQRVPLGGRVFAPKPWRLTDLTLRVERIGSGETRPDDSTEIPLSRMFVLLGRPGWLRWRAGSAEPGRYRLTIVPTGVTTEIDIAPPGCDDAEIELPEATQLTASVLDESGSEVTLDVRAGWALAWLVDGEAADELLRARSISDHAGWFGPIIGFRNRTAIDEPQRPTAIVPASLGSVVLNDPEWLIASGGEHELEPGEQEIVVRVRRAPSLELRFMHGDEPVRWPDGSIGATGLDAIRHAGRSTSIEPREFGARMLASAAGRYRVRVPPIPGYAKVDPFEVELRAGELVTRVVQLQPR